MPTVTLHIGESGKLEGLSERDRKAYAKFRRRLDSLGEQSITFTWREPRSGPFHRRFFAILNAFFESQEQFTDQDHFLTWLKVGAGYADLVPGPKGKPVAMARSINWESIDQAEFEPIAQSIWSFMRTTYATRFLWPESTGDATAGLVESILAGFGE